MAFGHQVECHALSKATPMYHYQFGHRLGQYVNTNILSFFLGKGNEANNNKRRVV